MPGSTAAWTLVLVGMILALVAASTTPGSEGLTPTPDLGASMPEFGGVSAFGGAQTPGGMFLHPSPSRLLGPPAPSVQLGAGVEWAPVDKITLIAEMFGFVRGLNNDARFQGGIRFTPVRAFDIDLIYGHSITGDRARK
jgi:hypothetical protein